MNALPSSATASLGSALRVPTALQRPGGRPSAAAKTAPRGHRRLEITSKWNWDVLGMDLGQTMGTIKRGEGLLNLPPGKVGLFGVRETLEYLADPRKFIKTRVEKYGPVFKTGFFFKPAIVFGSKQAVEEYRAFEAGLPADEALPETFRELHTAYGALRQSGAQHKATRANFGKVLGRAALAHYAPIIARQTRDFVQTQLAEAGTLQPGYECRQHCLKSLFELFIGTVPPEETMMKMYDYNGGLLSLGKMAPEFQSGKKALDDLTEFILKHYRTIKAQDNLNLPEYFFLKQYSEAVDENGELFTDERIATTCVLMVWGAYIEAAASMGHTAWLLMRNPEAAVKVREETRKALTPEVLASGKVSLETMMSMRYTEAVVKETLRVVPQTAGGLRVNPELRQLAGYDIPAGYVLTADPRIPFLDPANYLEPEEFRPERFLPEGAAAGNTVSADTFFPGGMGQHQCPGLNLSTLMTQMFLAYMTCTFDSWEPDLTGEGTPDPSYIQVPIVIIDDQYKMTLTKNWRYDL